MTLNSQSSPLCNKEIQFGNFIIVQVATQFPEPRLLSLCQSPIDISPYSPLCLPKLYQLTHGSVTYLAYYTTLSCWDIHNLILGTFLSIMMHYVIFQLCLFHIPKEVTTFLFCSYWYMEQKLTFIEHSLCVKYFTHSSFNSYNNLMRPILVFFPFNR